MSDLRKLKALATAIRNSLYCYGGRDDGADWSRTQKGFDEHAYDEYRSDGTEGCLHCMAVDALGRKRGTLGRKRK